MPGWIDAQGKGDDKGKGRKMRSKSLEDVLIEIGSL